ncbi:Pilus formation protein N terminal region [Faunimonas pinastri]|uniref:Pilus formation protein N terminal region n=1 Tax=Faunimonas pinastri TaxID=1855383 RepID=A0A1H9HI83_9HYPH|nr:pilus assembly protein N-terminal domain-containing protein [Faunimonas pinastri]SEQ62071.1 Pilus formation protein N terminal region [Faunimonas pinastri]
MRAYRSGLKTALLALVLGAAGLQSARAADAIDLTIDFAKLLKLNRPATTIVIGNPGIADATVGSNQTIVLTGHSAGTTNMIAMDDKGHEILNTTVRVSSDSRQLTTVFYGNKRQTFSCDPVCEQVVAVGDAPDAFAQAKSQIQSRQEISGIK